MALAAFCPGFAQRFFVFFFVVVVAFAIEASFVQSDRSRSNPCQGSGDWSDLLFLILREGTIIEILDGIDVRDSDYVVSCEKKVKIYGSVLFRCDKAPL